MKEKIPILVLRLEGPLQSWGEHSKWDHRDTAPFPSKSGIVGLLACALGYCRDDPRIAELCSELTVAVRADRTGEIIEDFHTVRSDNLLNSQGKKRGESGTIVTRRDYIMDASYLVCIAGSAEMLNSVNEALNRPKWVTYLGRKSCVPSVPIIGRIVYDYSSLYEAVIGEPLCDRHDRTEYILAELESSADDGYLRPDVRTAQDSRSFAYRAVKTIALKAGEVGKR